MVLTWYKQTVNRVIIHEILSFIFVGFSCERLQTSSRVTSLKSYKSEPVVTGAVLNAGSRRNAWSRVQSPKFSVIFAIERFYSLVWKSPVKLCALKINILQIVAQLFLYYSIREIFAFDHVKNLDYETELYFTHDPKGWPNIIITP